MILLFAVAPLQIDIGFINGPYRVNESDGFAVIQFGILNDVPEGTKIPFVTLVFSNLTAKSILKHCISYAINNNEWFFRWQ